jgi:Tol biopolymer transport system component
VWSPDGHTIAFYSNRTAEGGNWIVDAKGGDSRFVTASDDAGEWSPDGRGLVVGRQGRLYRVAKDGGAPVPLPSTGGRPSSPRFSRDGQSIYYVVNSGPRENHDIWKLSLGDGKVSRLTKLEGRHGNIGYTLSSDSRYLYFTWREDDGDIWVMDVVNDGSE